MNLNKLLTKTKKIALVTGRYAKKEFYRFQRSQIETKSNPNDLVSYVDKETERQLISALLKLTPRATVIGEEKTSPQEKTELTWIIDPIDGTVNFVYGIPIFALSIALLYKNELVLGIIYNPAMELMYYATSNTSTRLNGKKIRVSSNTETKKGIISLGVSPAIMFGKKRTDKQDQHWFFKSLPALMGQVRGIRALGSAAMSMAWVASGQLDAYYERGLNAWDIAAGGLIVRQAGGKVTDFSQKDDFLFQKELIATGKIYSQFYKLLKSQSLVS